MANRYNFSSPGADMQEAILQLLMDREVAKRQAMLDEFAKQKHADEMKRSQADLSFRQQQEARLQQQMQMDVEDRAAERAAQAAAQRKASDQAGVRQMIASTVYGGELTPERARSAQQMGYTEGVAVPGIVEQAMKPPAPRRTTSLSPGAILVDEDTGKQIAQGAPPREPQGPQGSPQWVIGPDGQQAYRVPRAGDRHFDPVANRTNAPNTDDARSVTETALAQAKRLYDPSTLTAHPGMDTATGAYELRGFTQDATDFNSIRDQLVAALALPNLGALKGPMSDNDIIFVKQLATRLENRKLSRQETERAIAEAITFLEGKLAGPAAPAPSEGGGTVQRWGRDAQGRPVRLR